MSKYIWAGVGAVIGLAASYFIDCVIHADVEEEKEPDISEELDAEDVAEIMNAATNLITECGYSAEEPISYDKAEPKPVEKPANGRPYVITPIEFAINDEYEVKTYHYYADEILTDENNDVMSEKEIEQTIGLGNLESFGLHEDDCVIVRNDELKCDFEVRMIDDMYAYHQTKYLEDDD